ncbi:MAG: HD domain-containing protein [Candidatus Poseidoniia archaeon]|nr:HD domain-containing protein [Candidatus Poseidoniia archaeon]
MTRVRDPIHDYIDLTPLEVRLVDTPAYQRLRWIRQLGPTNLVYPGANHTRHEHCMGTCHVVGRIADSIGLDSHDKQLASVAGLLHDLGHSPFSHLGDEVAGLEDHVIRTTKLVSDTEISDILSEEGIDSKEINEIIQGAHKLGPLVSGDLDGDRLDYLVRDAHYTGVSTGVDAGRLITTMAMVDENLVVHQGGLPAVEALLTARFAMYPTVYFHSFVRGAELMLARAANSAISSNKFTYDDFATFTDHQFLSELDRAGGFPQKTVKDFENRRIVKSAVSITKKQAEDSGLNRSSKEEYENSIAAKLGLDASDIYVDLPPLSVVPGLKVKILKDNDEVVLARNLSRLVSGLYEAQFDHWRGRVYGPSEIEDEVSSEASKVLGL